MLLTNPTIYNLTLTLANTEYSQALSLGAGYIEVQCRQIADVKMAFTSGASGTTYKTIFGGSQWNTGTARIRGDVTLYFQSTSGGVVVEILAWTS